LSEGEREEKEEIDEGRCKANILSFIFFYHLVFEGINRSPRRKQWNCEPEV